MTLRLLLMFLLMTAVATAESNPRTVLFFDLWKLDYWDNVELRQGKPEWVRECEYVDPSARDRSMVFPFVWKNKETGKWQVIYSVKWSPFTLMAAVSDDGIHWEPLAVPDSPVPESLRLASNHLLTAEGTSGGGVYVDPQQTGGYRFRILGRRHGQSTKRYDGEGVTFISKDGLHWETKTGGHWNWLGEDWLPEPPTFTFWLRKRPNPRARLPARLGRSTPMPAYDEGFQNLEPAASRISAGRARRRQTDWSLRTSRSSGWQRCGLRRSPLDFSQCQQ